MWLRQPTYLSDHLDIFLLSPHKNILSPDITKVNPLLMQTVDSPCQYIKKAPKLKLQKRLIRLPPFFYLLNKSFVYTGVVHDNESGWTANIDFFVLVFQREK